MFTRHRLVGLLACATLALYACDDGEDTVDPDSSVETDAGGGAGGEGGAGGAGGAGGMGGEGGGADPCVAACDTLADCAASDDFCPDIDADGRDDLVTSCLDTCAGQPALAAVVNGQDNCDDTITFVSGASADFAAACEGGAGGEGGMGGAGGEGGMGGMGGEGGGGDPLSCEKYCDLMEANCAGAYPDREACQATCGLFPDTGMEGDQEGNSVQCRAYHAEVAEQDAALHCPHASMNGGGVCGSYCEAYCTIATQTCGDLYGDEESCMAECEAFPDDGEYDAVDGDSVQCRTYHASFPAIGDAALHCPHASPSGGDVCGTYCDVYCDRTMANCGDLYADEAACQTTCETFSNEGNAGDVDGNSVQCRIYHGNLPAAEDPALHCGHASLNGGGVCGDYCEVYCAYTATNCEGDAAVFADEQQCLQTCQAYPTDGAPTAVDGNSVQCRSYHASFPAAGDAGLHCPHAGATGGGVCGSRCEGYCNQMMENCPSAFADFDTCLAGCALYPEGAFDDTEGDTVQCRTYHASFPAVGDPELHCPHASLGGGGVCGDECGVYCNYLDANCGDHPQYDNNEACQATCREEIAADGAFDATGGDSLQCRIYHASFPAAADPATHCAHAGLGGGGVCAGEPEPEPCDVYCDAMAANCGEYYPDRDICMQACSQFPVEGAVGDVEGNSVHCRAYHAGVAAEDPALHCPHASINGGGVCGSYCEGYCGYMMANCEGSYADEEACMAECAAFPTDGEGSAVDGDSVQCRAYHASFPAAGDPELHCPHAGPNGGNVCGSWCDVYCERTMANCDGLYADEGACMSACGEFPTDGNNGATDGNSVQCRIYHGNLPAAGDAALHCPHAGQAGGGVCGSYCDVYCDMIERNCDGVDSNYPDRQSCVDACAAFPTDGVDGAVEGDSVQCRVYHSSFPAAADAGLHCPHASISGGGVCGSACDSYCSQTAANCPDLHADDAACRADCAQLTDNGEWNATDGDSLQCRAYHASFPAAADPDTHCPHAALDGGGVCVDAN